jgi:hypothetical protein
MDDNLMADPNIKKYKFKFLYEDRLTLCVQDGKSSLIFSVYRGKRMTESELNIQLRK